MTNRTTRECEYCGKTFAPLTSEVRRGRGRFCTRAHARYGAHPPLVSRFWAKVDTSGECWLWTGGTFSSGYGNFRVNGRRIGAHRFCWKLHHGPIPDGLQVLHNCPGGDNRACVRPDHLFLGTQADNLTDMVLKGRHKGRLSKSDVHAIREKLAAGMTQMAIASEYDIGKTTVSDLHRRTTWSCLPDMNEASS